MLAKTWLCFQAGSPLTTTKDEMSGCFHRVPLSTSDDAQEWHGHLGRFKCQVLFGQLNSSKSGTCIRESIGLAHASPFCLRSKNQQRIKHWDLVTLGLLSPLVLDFKPLSFLRPMDVEICGQLTLRSRSGPLVVGHHLMEADAGGGLHGCSESCFRGSGKIRQECLPVVPTQKLSHG